MSGETAHETHEQHERGQCIDLKPCILRIASTVIVSCPFVYFMSSQGHQRFDAGGEVLEGAFISV
jgi:hypothetical protein